jgi:hypothetical protein
MVSKAKRKMAKLKKCVLEIRLSNEHTRKDLCAPK